MKIIEQLTPEQEALATQIKDKWMAVALSTKKPDIAKAEQAICLHYHHCRRSEPREIKWFDNPIDGANWLNANLKMLGYNSSITANVFPCKLPTGKLVQSAISPEVEKKTKQLINYPLNAITRVLYDAIKAAIGSPNRRVVGSFWLDSLAQYSFFKAIGIDECSSLQGLWSLAEEASCYWLTEKCAMVVPNPSVISLNSESQLHGNGKPAIVYQGFSYYAFNGIRLPKKYGGIPTEEWQVAWLIEETDSKLKKVLFKGIGYERICKEIPSKVIDSDGRYSLLQLEIYNMTNLLLYENYDEYYDYEDKEERNYPLLILKKVESQQKNKYWIIPEETSSIEEAFICVSDNT